MTDTVLAQLNALKTLPIAELKAKWRDLYDREPPAFNRRYLESRLAYAPGLRTDQRLAVVVIFRSATIGRLARQAAFVLGPAPLIGAI